MWAFYWDVFKRSLRGLHGPVGWVELGLTILGGVVSTFRPLSGIPRWLTWGLPLTALALTWLYRFIQAPYKIYLETLAQIPNVDRGKIRDRLSQLLMDGNQVIKDAEYSGVSNFAEEIIGWRRNVERFLSADLGKAYIARYRNIAGFDERMIYGAEQGDVIRALKNGCNLLDNLTREFS